MACLKTPPATYPGLAYAETLANMGHNTGLYLKLSELFIEQHGHDIALIETALKLGNRELATQLTHALRGTAGNLGAITLYHCLGDFESALQAKKPVTRVPATMQQAMTELLSVLGSLISDLSTPQTPAQSQLPVSSL